MTDFKDTQIRHLQDKIKGLESVLYAILKKYPDGVEVSNAMITKYNGGLPNMVGDTYNPQRDSHIYYIIPEKDK